MVDTFNVRVTEEEDERESVLSALADFGLDDEEAETTLDLDGIVERDVDETTAEGIVETLLDYFTQYSVAVEVDIVPSDVYCPMDLRGRVFNTDTGEPIASGGIVTVAPASGVGEPFGSAEIEHDGWFVIEGFTEVVVERFGAERPELEFTVSVDDQELEVSSKPFSWAAFMQGGDSFEFDIYVEVPPQPVADFVVQGTVQIEDCDDEPLAGLLVRAFDRDLRNEQLLGEGTTDENGHYEISYTAADFSRAEKESADLLVRTYNEVESLVAESETVFNAGHIQMIDLDVEYSDDLLPSEYERLRHELRPVLGGVSLADLGDEDIEFLYAELDVEGRVVYPDDVDVIRALIEAVRLSHVTAFDLQIVYALVRVLEIDRPSLANGDATEFASAIETAVEASIVDVELDGLVDRLTNFIDLTPIAERIPSNLVPQTAVPRLIEQGTGRPLAGYSVRITDAPLGVEILHNTDVTDGHGNFEFSYLVPRDESESEADGELEQDEEISGETASNGSDATEEENDEGAFTIQILDNGRTISERTVRLRKDPTRAIRIQLPPPGFDTGVPLGKLANTTGVDLPTVNTPAGDDITLADIREAGGIVNINDTVTSSEAKRVDSLATMALFVPLQTAGTLYERGYTSHLDVIAESEISFLKSVKNIMDRHEARRVRTRAMAMADVVNGVLLAARIEAANREGNPPLQGGGR